MSKNNIGIIVSIIIAIVGWVKYFQNSGDVVSISEKLSAQTKELTQSTEKQTELTGITNSLQEELAQYKQAKAQNEANTQALQAIIDDTKRNLDTVSARTVEVESTVQNLRNELAAALERESRAENAKSLKTTELQRRLEQLLEENSGLTVALAGTYKDIESLNNTISESGDTLTTLKNELDILKVDHENLTTELDRERANQSSVSGELESQMTSFLTLQSDFDKLNADHENLKAELISESASLSSVNDELESQKDSFLRLQNDFDTLNANHENLKAELVSERANRSSVSGELETQMASLSASENELELAVKEQGRLQQLLIEARNRAEKTEELEAKLSLVDADVATKTNALATSKEQVELLQGELETINQKRDELVQQLEAKESLVENLNAKHRATEEQLEKLRSEMATVAKSAELEIQNLKDSVTLIRMDSDIVFAPGSTRLRQGGQAVLDKVIEYALSVPDRMISLEGHTDNIPISAEKQNRFPSNWELSAARAGSAVRYLQDNGIAANRMRVSGYGQHRPVADNSTVEGRSANRRLEIVLSPATFIEKSTIN